MYFLLWTTLVIFVMCYFYNLFKHRRYYELISKLPSPHITVIGVLILFFKSVFTTFDPAQTIFEELHKWTRRYYDQGILSESFSPFANHAIVLISPRAYKDMLMDQNNTFKNISYIFLREMIGNRNLIMSGGSEWKQDRKIANPSFKYSKLISMNELISKRVDILVSHIQESGNKIKNMQIVLSSIITHVILEAATGHVIDPKDSRLIDYNRGQQLFARYIVIRGTNPLTYLFPPLFDYTIGLPLTLAKKRIWKFISEAIDRRINIIQNEQVEMSCLTDTFIQAHLEDPNKIPKQVIVNNAATFVFVGHKATSFTLNAILFLLAAHPDKQKKLQKELDSYFTLANIEESILDIEQLNKCEYLTAVIKEGQRMYPISASIGRKVTKEFKCMDYTIPVGCEIAFDFNSLTKHPESFPYKPFDYIPERFLPGEEGWDDNRHPFAFLPFSHGLRKCIGEKFAMNILRVFLIKMLLKYNLSTTQSMDSIKLVQDIMVYIRTPIDIEFTERDNNNNNQPENTL